MLTEILGPEVGDEQFSNIPAASCLCEAPEGNFAMRLVILLQS
jgi:hypothetical protein